MKEELLKELLEKYYDGRTSLGEEQALKEYFRKSEPPEGYEAEARIFRSLDSMAVEIEDEDFSSRIIAAVDESEKGRKQRVTRTRIMTFTSIAAGLLILVASYFLLKQKAEPQDTFSDPRIAYAETMKILNEVSVKLNRGTRQLKTVSEMENSARATVSKVGRSASVIQKSLSPISMIKMLDNQDKN